MNRVRKYFRDLAADLKGMWSRTEVWLSAHEAVRADNFETELYMLTRNAEEREGIRQGALLIAKLGIPYEEFEAALIEYARGQQLAPQLTPDLPH